VTSLLIFKIYLTVAATMSHTVSQLGEGKELKHKPIVLVTNYKHNFMNGKYTLQYFIADIKAINHYTQDQQEQPVYLFFLLRFVILNLQTDFGCNSANNKVTAGAVIRPET
jgi:hypothetical protein